jgi:hypothetical protein
MIVISKQSSQDSHKHFLGNRQHSETISSMASEITLSRHNAVFFVLNFLSIFSSKLGLNKSSKEENAVLLFT